MLQRLPLLAAFCLLLPTSMVAADEGDFDGEWRTSFGIVTLEQTGNDVTGTYGDAGQFTLTGKVDDKKLTFEYQEGQLAGNAKWTLDDTGNSFNGKFQIRNGRAGQWTGWRPDSEALNDKLADFSGFWLTDLGLMELQQDGDKVKGRFALRGDSEIEGTVTGRRFEFIYKTFRPGKGWLDLSTDETTLTGAASTDGFAAWFGWRGRRALEFVRHVKLEPGKIVDGSTRGLLTYSIRAPEGYKENDDKKWPAIVILHGSNMNGKAYVNTIAAAWPDIAKDYLLIGINGERPSNTADDPQFNYFYVNYMGRSTLKGFPGTDRDSPALVADALDDLQEAYPIDRYFVGGHSQGGYLTYSLLMNFPEKLAGAFPISGGVMFQCEPNAFDDEKLRESQRKVPLAIVHGKGDPLVNFSSGEYAATIFGEAGWPALRFFSDDTGAGHMFARLPVDKAIRWLEAQTSDDPVNLLDFAEQSIKEKRLRDAVATLNRARELQSTDNARFDKLSNQMDTQASSGAAEFLSKIHENQSNDWIDAFLTYRDDFEFAPAAGEVMQSFNALRAEHEEHAKKAFNEARAEFQRGNRDEGYAKYQEIVDNYYASSYYRNVKKWLAERK